MFIDLEAIKVKGKMKRKLWKKRWWIKKTGPVSFKAGSESESEPKKECDSWKLNRSKGTNTETEQ